MKNIKILLIVALSMIVLNTHAQMLSKGVSKELADHRKANISKIVYDLSFDIPANPREPVTGKAIISFNLKAPQDVVLDFQGQLDGTCYVYVEKKKGKMKRMPMEVTYQDEHIILPMLAMQDLPLASMPRLVIQSGSVSTILSSSGV